MNKQINAAKLARANGWKPGDILRVQPSGWPEPGTVKLTAIGETAILVRRKGYSEFALHGCAYDAITKVERHEG